MSSRARRVRNVLVPLALVLGAVWCAYFWILHAWLAGGPPTPYPEWHYARSQRYGILTYAFLALIPIWLLRHRVTRLLQRG